MAPIRKVPRLVSWLPCQSHEPVITRGAAPLTQVEPVPPTSEVHCASQSGALAIALHAPKSRVHAETPQAVCVPKLLATRKDAPFIHSSRLKGLHR